MTDGDICIANIGPRQRRLRLQIGVLGLAGGAFGAVAMIVLGVPRLTRFALMIPFTVGLIGFLQYKEKT